MRCSQFRCRVRRCRARPACPLDETTDRHKRYIRHPLDVLGFTHACFQLVSNMILNMILYMVVSVPIKSFLFENPLKRCMEARELSPISTWILSFCEALIM